MMLSIGRFAKLAQVSPRTVRHYEALGLLEAAVRGENSYRYYRREQLARLERIQELKSLGFSLEETKTLLGISEPRKLTRYFERKLSELEAELDEAQKKRERLRALLSVTRKIDSSQPIEPHERKSLMEAIREEILETLRSRTGHIKPQQLKYLERDPLLSRSETRELAEAVKSCVDFARSRGLSLGPGRGAAPSSIAVFGLGMSALDPSGFDLIPERLSSIEPDIHIDVEFECGQEFVDYCRDISSKLSFGKINAFKMPLIDILKRTEARIGGRLAQVDPESEAVLAPFRAGKVEKIFLFDMSRDALIMRFENYPNELLGPERIGEYLSSQPIRDFRDVMNISALWRPSGQEMLARMERYRRAKEKPFRYECLTPELQRSLEPNYGRILYHEDLIRVISTYTGWDLGQSNDHRRELRDGRGKIDRAIPVPVAELVQEENPWTFCFSHTVAFSELVKQTAFVQNQHRDVYFDEIIRFEQKHGLRWDDIGVRIKGVALLQS